MKYLLISLSLALSLGVQGQSAKKDQDREAIKSMVGCHRVDFQFAETFSPDTGYKYHDRYHTWAVEHVSILEDKPNFISLQHLLVINDTMVIKHWRQDWAFEETTLVTFDRDKSWKKVTYKPEEVKGTWTQKVFQVDDSPRYEAKGTWVHVDGKHYWEATGDAPLPRREATKRNDYNVMRRNIRIEITENGWFYEQDNEKILRTAEGDQLICLEKGMETFVRGDYDCQAAVAWWDENNAYWAAVRDAWTEVFAESAGWDFEGRVDGEPLWQQLFELGDAAVENNESPKKLKSEAKALIQKYIKA